MWASLSLHPSHAAASSVRSHLDDLVATMRKLVPGFACVAAMLVSLGAGAALVGDLSAARFELRDAFLFALIFAVAVAALARRSRAKIASGDTAGPWFAG